MRTKTTERSFDFPLSDQRLAEIAREIADNMERVNNLEESFDAAKEAKKEVPALLQHVRELSHFIKTGAENKNVVCTIEYDKPDPGLKQIIRTDTGEVVDTMEMTGEEMQGELSIGEDGDLRLPDPPKEEGNTDESPTEE